MRTRTVAEFLSAHFQTKWTEEAGEGLLPPPCIHPPRDLVKGGRDSWRRGLKDLIRWISWGRFHLYAGIVQIPSLRTSTSRISSPRLWIHWEN
jgi:hypothetical protein